MSTLYVQLAVNFAYGEEIGGLVSNYYEKYVVHSDEREDYRYALGMIATDGLFICPVSAMARYSIQGTWLA